MFFFNIVYKGCGGAPFLYIHFFSFLRYFCIYIFGGLKKNSELCRKFQWLMYYIVSVSDDGRREVVASTPSRSGARLGALACYRQDLSKSYIVVSM